MVVIKRELKSFSNLKVNFIYPPERTLFLRNIQSVLKIRIQKLGIKQRKQLFSVFFERST